MNRRAFVIASLGLGAFASRVYSQESPVAEPVVPADAPTVPQSTPITLSEGYSIETLLETPSSLGPLYVETKLLGDPIPPRIFCVTGSSVSEFVSGALETRVEGLYVNEETKLAFGGGKLYVGGRELFSSDFSSNVKIELPFDYLHDLSFDPLYADDPLHARLLIAVNGKVLSYYPSDGRSGEEVWAIPGAPSTVDKDGVEKLAQVSVQYLCFDGEANLYGGTMEADSDLLAFQGNRLDRHILSTATLPKSDSGTLVPVDIGFANGEIVLSARFTPFVRGNSEIHIYGCGPTDRDPHLIATAPGHTSMSTDGSSIYLTTSSPSSSYLLRLLKL